MYAMKINKACVLLLHRRKIETFSYIKFLKGFLLLLSWVNYFKTKNENSVISYSTSVCFKYIICCFDKHLINKKIFETLKLYLKLFLGGTID